MNQNPTKILVAEDSPTQAHQLRYMLAHEGYDVTVAVNGRIALEAAAQVRPSLIISDVVMPEMDGYELSAALKADPALRDIPIILVTTLSDPEDVIRGLECGADNFVLKPYDQGYLLSRVRFVILNGQMRRPNDVGMGVEIYFNSQRHFITADRLQILNLLLSTYDAAIQRNRELNRTQDELQETKRELEEKVKERTRDLERTNQALRESEALIRLTIDTALDAHVTIDGQGIVTGWNTQAERVFGWTRGEALGAKLHELIIPLRYRESHVEGLRHFASTGYGPLLNRRVEVTALRRDGGEFPVELSIVPITVQGERMFSGFIRDITERKEAEEKIHRMNEELERRVHERTEELQASNRDLESFSYSVSHDLRAPLRALDGFSRILQEDYSDRLDAEGRRYLSTISESSRTMGLLIDDLLAFSRLGRVPLTKHTVDMNGVVREVIGELSTQQGRTAPRIDVSPLPEAAADRALIRQVWTNLISNAVKYSSKSAHPEIQITGEVHDAETVYSVRDNGAGFDMKYYHKLFGVFQRLHPNQQFEGTGVGLAIVQRIVSRHGGRVWAEGRIDEGAIFSFSLPR